MNFNLSDLSGFDVNVKNTALINITKVDQYINRLDGTNTGGISCYIYYRIPVKLPIGARVDIDVEARGVSGGVCQLAFDSFTSDDFSTGKGFNGGGDIGEDGGFRHYKFNTVVTPSRRYLQVTMGWYSGRVGIADIRGITLKISNADDAALNPELEAVKTYSKYYSAKKIAKEWMPVLSGAGSVVNAADKITFNATFADRAYILLGRGDKTDSLDMTLSKGFIVEVSGKKISGHPAIAADYYNASDVNFRTLDAVFMGNDGEILKYYFPPISTASYAKLAIGSFTQNNCVFELYSVKITQLDGYKDFNLSEANNFGCSLLKGGSGWVIDDATATTNNRFSNINIASVTVQALYLDCLFTDTLKGKRPLVMANLTADSDRAATHYCSVAEVTNTGFRVVFYDRATNAAVSPNVISATANVSVMGFNSL